MNKLYQYIFTPAFSQTIDVLAIIRNFVTQNVGISSMYGHSQKLDMFADGLFLSISKFASMILYRHCKLFVYKKKNKIITTNAIVSVRAA